MAGLFGQDGPALVVSPAVANLQVARRIPFLGETTRPDERDRCRIARLDVGLETMQLERSEPMAHGRPQAFAHQALALVTGEGVVADVGAAKQAANDVRDLDDADQRAAVATADQQGAVRRRRDPSEVLAELSGSNGRRDPRIVKCAAAPNRAGEVALIAERGFAEANSRAHRRPAAVVSVAEIGAGRASYSGRFALQPGARAAGFSTQLRPGQPPGIGHGLAMHRS